jgi:serine/threonine protein kinase SCH9
MNLPPMPPSPLAHGAAALPSSDLNRIESHDSMSPPLFTQEGEEERAQSSGSSSSYNFCLDSSSKNTPRRSNEARSSSSSRGYVPVTSAQSSGAVSYTSAINTLVSRPKHASSKYSSSTSISNLSIALSQSRLPNERSKLIGDMKLLQNTPPQTPRTRSQEDENGSGMSTPSRLPAKEIPTAAGPVLGKLTVDISEGRGLRPSVDPYVVCEFQLSQYISEGPIGGKRKDGNVQVIPQGFGAQFRGDRMRPLAIPMRSRQSSNSGRDPNTQQEVTNPRWDHKAVL